MGPHQFIVQFHLAFKYFIREMGLVPVLVELLHLLHLLLNEPLEYPLLQMWVEITMLLEKAVHHLE